MSKNLIRDGQTRKGRIDAEERMHEALDFKYRPMLTENVEAVQQASQEAESVKKGIQIIAGALAKQLVEWSEVEDDGTGTVIQFSTVSRLPIRLFHRLWRVIAGLEPSDLIPDPTTVEQDEYIASLTEGVGEDETEKNSTTA